MVEHTDFVSVPTQDMARAKAFYGETLGLPMSGAVGDSFAEFETGNLTLLLMDPSAVGQEFRPSSSAIALRVPDVQAERRAAGRGRRDVLRRRDGHRRVPHGPVRRPRRQRTAVAPPLRAQGVATAVRRRRGRRGVPIVSGRTSPGIPRQTSASASTRPNCCRMRAAMGRLHRQPPANAAHGRSRRSWTQARVPPSARTCSRKRNRPSGRSTRWISLSAASGSSTVHSTSVETTTSNAASEKGSASARASRISARRPLACTRSRSRWRIGATGSVSVSSMASG